MIRRILLAAVTAAMLAAMAPVPSASASPAGSSWMLNAVAAPTNFAPGDRRNDYYQVEALNLGGAPTDGSDITISDTLPAGLTVRSIEFWLHETPSHFADFGSDPAVCDETSAGGSVTVTCKVSESIPGTTEPARVDASQHLRILIYVAVPRSASGRLENRATVEGGGAASVAVETSNEASDAAAPSGFSEFRGELANADGSPASAAAHPFGYTTRFAVNTELAPEGSVAPVLGAGGDLKNIEATLPPGLVGNPLSVEHCTSQQFTTVRQVVIEGVTRYPNECPEGSIVGTINISQVEGVPGGKGTGPVYALNPPPGMPAQFGFQVASNPIYINTRVRSGSDYGITASLPDTSEVKRVTAATVTFWGVPAAAIHDPARGLCGEVTVGSCPAGMEPRPLLRLPTSCSAAMPFGMSIDTWLNPGAFYSAGNTEPAPTGCAAVPFAPTIEARPTTDVADAPSGLHVDVHLPQRENEAPEGLGEADLKDATVTLPPGLVVNPSSADGLGACSEAQIGYRGEREGRLSFSDEAANCPDASKLGTVEIDTPLVDHPLPGAVYLARQGENPFGSLIAIYITVADPQTGVVVKLPGKVSPDPVTGQLTTTVKQSPQLPFEDFKLDFFEGARGPLRTPAVCAGYMTTTAMVPWSSPQGATATPSDSFAIAKSPGGGACPTSAAQRPAAPRFEAGAAAPLAGAYSPFLLHLARADGSQEFKGLDVTLPPGLLGKLAGIPYCPDAALAAAAAKSGRAEQAAPSCPAASRVGGVTVGAGAGPDPFYVGGTAYLAGPYKGAPLSLAIVTPAVAGPFDLGTVVVRSALRVNPETAQVSVESDPIPTILRGIPLDVRSIAVRMDRPGFTLNPTSCAEKAIGGRLLTAQGRAVPLTNRFQVGGCRQLPFGPKLKLRLKGATGRIGHPALKAVLTAKPGEANIARAQVNLPHGEFLDQGNIDKACTKPVLLAGACPARSVYGQAKAWTPLLDRPLEGPVFLVGGYGYKLPALVAELNGQIRVLLVGKVDSGKNKGIRSTFEVVPDAPVSRFVLEMKGGKKYGLLENSENLCKAKKSRRRAIVRFTGQNGKVDHYKPVVANQCGKGKRHAKRKKSHGHSRHTRRADARPGRRR